MRTPLPVALVPWRASPVPKRRLAHVASADERRTLIHGSFAHVVTVLRDVGLKVIALAPHEIDDAQGAEVWRDRRRGLNAAVHDAVGRIGGPVIVVHADLPWLSSEDVDLIMDASADVVIGRAYDGGTNVLLMREPIRPAFGPRSAHAHASRARRAGFRTLVLDLPTVARDVDDGAVLTAWRGAASPLPRP